AALATSAVRWTWGAMRRRAARTSLIVTAPAMRHLFQTGSMRHPWARPANPSPDYAITFAGRSFQFAPGRADGLAAQAVSKRCIAPRLVARSWQPLTVLKH